MDWRKLYYGSRAARRAAVLAVVGAARAVQFEKAGSDVVYIVGRSTYTGNDHDGRPYREQWQVSRIDSIGPSGHHNEKSLEAAIGSAIGAHPDGGYWDDGDSGFCPTEWV